MNFTDDLLMVFGSGICALALGGVLLAVLLLRSRELKFLKIAGVAILVALVFFLCSSISLSPVLTGAPSPVFKPSESDIVGTYKLDDSPTLLSKNILLEKGYSFLTGNNTLELHNDGTFLAVNMPDLIIDELNSVSEYVTGRGNWEVKFDNVNREWLLYLQFSELSNKPFNQATQFQLYGRESPYILYYTVGDPDSHQAVSYRMQK